MGLFSSSYKTTVGTTISRVIEDASLPESVKTGVINSVFEQGNMDEHILEQLIGSVGVKAGRMYEYGKNGYVYGLPSSTLTSTADGEDVVGAQLKVLFGVSTVMDYCHYGPMNLLHLGWTTLKASHGYNPSTNRLGVLTAAKGYPVYLKDMVVVVTEASLEERANGSLDHWGIPANAGDTPLQGTGTYVTTTFNKPTPFAVDPSAVGDYLLISYMWKGAGGVLHEESFTISVASTGYLVDASYYQVRYTNASGSGYWIYKVGTGTYPEIDAVYSTEHTGLGSFFPFGYFRYEKTSMAVDTSSVEYKSSKKLVKYLGMDFDAIVAGIHENPDIAQVEQAMVMMAVPANTTNPLERRYLYEFFSRLYLDSGALGVGVGQHSGVETLPSLIVDERLHGAINKVAMVIQDAKFKMTIGCRNIFKRKKVGVIGVVGSHTSGLETVAITNTAIHMETGLPFEWISQVPVHSYRKQITEALYEEIQVYDLRMSYHIYGDYSAVGDEADAILLIPLDHSITDSYNTTDKEILYARSLHYVFNSRIVTKVKWYQRGIFLVLVQVVGIVLLILDPPAGLALLAATMTAQQIIVILAMALLDYVLVVIGIKLFIKAVGAKVAFLVAIVAAVSGVVLTVEAGSIAGAPWAKELLQLSSNLAKGVSGYYSDKIQGIQKDLVELGTYAEEKFKEIEERNKLLESSSVLSPFVIFGESPDEFFNRTVHSGNIGIRGIEAVSNYVGMALTLPKLSESLGEPAYGSV